MPDAAQFTLNLFDSTALGSTMETPKTWEPFEASAEPELDTSASSAAPQSRGTNFQLKGDRRLARGWHARAKDNIAASEFRLDWEDIGRDLAEAVTPAEYATLQRATQL